MKVSVADYERAVRATEERLARERADAEAAAVLSSEARSKLDELAARAGELERQLLVQTAEAEALSRRVQNLEGRLDEQGRLLAEREFEIGRLRGELEEAGRIENDLREQLENASGRSSGAVEKFRADIAQLEAQLTAAVEERTKLQHEIAAMKREAETTWAAERVENSLLRERINDVAAEVARLTAVLEGPGSPIEAMLAEAVPEVGQVRAVRMPINGTSGETGTATIDTPQDKVTLADRIRALQSTASRAASN